MCETENRVGTGMRWHRDIMLSSPRRMYPSAHQRKTTCQLFILGNELSLIGSLLPTGKIQIPLTGIQSHLCPKWYLSNFPESSSVIYHIIPTLNDAPEPFTCAVSSKMFYSTLSPSKTLLILYEDIINNQLLSEAFSQCVLNMWIRKKPVFQSRYQSLIRYIICKYFLPFLRLPFYSGW